MRMKKWLVASAVMLAVQVNAANQDGLEEGVSSIAESVYSAIETSEVNGLKAAIKRLEAEVLREKEELTRMSKSVDTPLKLAVEIVQKLEPGLYVAAYNGERFILSSDRIGSTGWFQQPIVRQKELIPMIMANGFEKDFAHFVDINMDANKYMEQEYKKIGFYKRREAYWEIQDQLKEKQDQLASLEGE